MNGRVLDRRSFIGALSLTATATGALFRGHLLTAAPGASSTASLSLVGGGEVGSWHVDDMWGHMPRYAHPISCHVVYVPMNLDKVHPVDHAIVA